MERMETLSGDRLKLAKQRQKKFFSQIAITAVWRGLLSSRGRELLWQVEMYVIVMQKRSRTEEGDESTGCEFHLASSGSN